MWSSSVTTKLSNVRASSDVAPAAEPEQDRAALERQLGRVRVRHVDDVGRAVGRAMAELAAVPAEGEVRDDVELLAGLGERALERAVVRGRHDQLMRRAALAEQRRQGGEEAVHRRRRVGAADERVRARRRAARSPCVTAAYCETRATSTGSDGGYAEALGERRRELVDRPEHRDEAAREQDVDDLREVVDGRARRRRAPSSSPASCRRIAPCSCRSDEPGSIPSSSASTRRASWYACSASACRPER